MSNEKINSEEISENNEKQQLKPVSEQRIETADEIQSLLKEKFASGFTKIFVNSLNREIGFREITVQQQKTLSRVMIGNENRKDIIYDAQCAIINETALEDGFSIYRLTELDRIKLLIALYQANMFNNDVQFTCKECGCENKYKINFDSVLLKLDKIETDPTTFHYENKRFQFDFEVSYPNVKLISEFHKQYCAKHKNTSKRDVKVNDTMSNMEYINLFIKSMKISSKSGELIKNIDFKYFTPTEIESILQTLPQDVLYVDNGILTYVTTEYLAKLNDAFDKHKCMKCGAIQEDENTNQVESFL